MDDLQRVYGSGGTYYPNAVVTTPLCCPSRASIFTGRYAHNHGVKSNNGNPLDQTTTMQCRLLQDLGYNTGLTGKYLNSFTGTPPCFDQLAVNTGYKSPTGQYGTTYVQNKAIEFMRTFESDDATPWLLFVHSYAPHPSPIPEAKYARAFVSPWQDTPANTETDLNDKPPWVIKEAASNSKAKIQAERIRAIRTLYSVGDLISAVFAEVDALDEQNTLAFFFSDNGYAWYEHQLWHKGQPYDDVVQVPFFARWPGHIPAGATDGRIVGNTDVAPTVYEVLGYAPPNYIPDGRSILTSDRDVILTEGFGRGFASLWTPEWMYAEYKDKSLEFYGPHDPWQLDNGFKTGDPPANSIELHDLLQSYKACGGVACP